MSIIADKKNGKLTGRFRVQVMVNYQLIRSRRLATIGEARALESHWLTLKAKGEAVTPLCATGGPVEARQAPAATPVAQEALSLSQARRKAEGRIWKGAWEVNCLGMLGIMQDLMGDCSLDAIDTQWAMRLKEKLTDVRKASGGTCNRYGAVLSKFLKWANKRGYRTVEAIPEFEFGKESEGRIRWISEDEEAMLMKLLPERTAKLVRFAILTGGRRGELLSLSPEDVFPNRIIFWGDETKSGKSRPIPLTDEGHELADWLVVQGNMPSPQLLRTDWAKARKSMGLTADKEFVFHGCRHTFAVRAVEKGVPIRTLQSWMGHETIEMTEKYGKVSGKALETARDLMFSEAA